MQLYEKVQTGKRVSYRPYQPPDNSMMELSTEQMSTLLATLTISMLMSVEAQLPNHSRFAREVANVENAVKKLAQLNGKPLDDKLIDVGVVAWNSAIRSMQFMLGGGAHG